MMIMNTDALANLISTSKDRLAELRAEATQAASVPSDKIDRERYGLLCDTAHMLDESISGLEELLRREERWHPDPGEAVSITVAGKARAYRVVSGRWREGGAALTLELEEAQ